MKKILQKLKITGGLLVVFWAIASTVYGGTVNDSSQVPNILYTTNKTLSSTDWGSSTTVSDGTQVSFELHYNINYGNIASNLKFFLENLDGRVFNSGHVETVSGSITADGVTNRTGSVIVNFNEKVKLNLYNVSWQKWPCQSVGCETTLPQNYRNVINGSGLNIGMVNGDDNSHYAGNLIVTFKAVKENGGGVVNNQATITTISATNVSDDCATLRANIDLNNDSSAQVRFRYGTSSSNLTDSTSYVTRNSSGNYSKEVCGLDDNRTYHFQAYLSNGDTGGVRNFTTDNNNSSSSNDEAEVTTESASSISETCATLKGDLDLNDEDDAYVKFEYGRDEDDLDDTVTYGTKSSNGTFSKRICGLREDTKYYYRAIISGGDKGSVKSFRTDDDNDNSSNNEDAEVTTKSATKIYSYTAQLNGSVDVNDTDSPRVYFEYGTSRYNLNKETSKVRVYNNSYFQSIVGLVPNTKYYFRAIVTDRNGNILDRGNTLSFVSAGETKPTSGRTDAMTTGAYAGTYAADLYGQIVGGDERVICYFEYGRTASLGSRTAYVTKNANTTKACSAKITGLRSNSKYYYRVVVIDDGVTYRGVIRSLTTKRTYTRPITPTRPTNNVTVNENVTVTVEEVAETQGINLQINKWVSQDKVDGYGLETNAKIGDTVYYKVRVKNNTNDDIENVTVTDHIPYELELSEERAIDDDVDKYLTWKIGKMRPGEVRTFVTEMIVSNKAQVGDVISSKAEISKDGEVEKTNSVDIYVRGNNQGASIFGADSSFFPTSLVGWLILLAMVLLIGFLITKIFATKRENDIKLEAFREAQREKYNR